MLDHPLPVISSVGQEGQRAPQPSYSDTYQKLAEDIQTIECRRQTFQPITHGNKGKVSQNETLLDNRCSPVVPIKQAGYRPEPRDETVNFNDRVEMVQGQKIARKNSEHSTMFSVSREIFRAKELHALESQSCNILTTSKLRSSQMTKAKMIKVETTLTTQCTPPKLSVPQDSEISDFQKQILTELKFKFKNKGHSQADHCPTDTSPTSSRLPSKSSQTAAQSVSTGDMAASQVSHIHSEDSGTSMEQRRDPSKQALLKCQDNNFPPAAERQPLGSKAGEYRSEDSGAGMSTGRKKSHPVEERELKDASSSLSQSEQLPTESFFRNKMRRFFQWIDFMRKIKDQESAQQKAKFMSTFAQHQDSTESAAFFVSHGPLEAHELMRAIGKILEEKLACRFESEALQLSQHKKELQTQVKPGKGHPSNYGALPDLRQEEWVQSQADPKSPLLVTPPGPLPQVRICGVYFHRPQNESESLSSSEIQQLEWNVLQKQQESLWGLPSVIQRSQEAFCPLAPNTSHHQHPQAHVSVSILPGEFALSDELRKKLEHHLRKRLIQHRWGLPRRIRESVSLMLPPDGFLEASKSESSDGVSLISVFKGQSSKHVSVESIQPGSFRERSSEMLQLEKDVGKDQEHSQENGQEDPLLKDPNSSSDKDLGYDSEKNISSQIVSLSEKNLRGSAESLQLENVLKVHLSKKFEEINEGRLPGTVHSSWHAIKQTLMLSAKSHTEMRERSLPSSVGECYSLNTFQDLTFVDPSAQQMLEAHIKRFRMRMLWGLPSKVLESIQIFKLKDASSQSLSHASFASSTNAISEPDSKFGNSKSFSRSSESFHGSKVGTTNSAPYLGHCLPATSPEGKGGQRVLRQSHSAVNHELAEDVQKIKDPRQIRLPVSLCITGRGSHRQVQLADGYPRKPLAKQAGARFEPKYKSISSSDKGKMQQGKKVKSEPVSMPKVSREIFKAEELECLQLKMNGMLTTNKSGSSQITNVNENKAETTVTTESPPPKPPVPQDPKCVSLKEQLLDELKFRLEKRKHSEAEGQPMDMSLASDNLTYKASLIPGQGVSGGDTGESQVLHVHVEDRGIRMEQQQEHWVPKHGFQRCQDKNFPPTVKRVSSPGCRAEELGGGDAGLGTSQLRRKSFPPQETVREEMLVSKSSQTLSKKGQSIPEGRIRKRMKHFLQWLYPGEKRKRREDPQEKGSPISSAQSRGLVESRAAGNGSTEAQKIVTDIRKFLEEKLGYRHALDATSSQEDPPLVHFGQSQKKAGVQVHTEPVREHPFNSKAPSKVTNPKSRHQEAILAGQCYPPSTRHIRNKKRQPQKAVAFKDQQLYQKHPPPVPHREPVPHPRPTHRCQAGQACPAVPTTAEGNVSRNLSLLFRQKTLLQISKEENFPSKNNSFLVENVDPPQ
ncbi:hypothetical protein MJT46_004768 [Ovis ammon polii x Ovis aries]|nr:hypothetical protein MJT46_004768 [Ovis ammon polii x Ovis aries]